MTEELKQKAKDVYIRCFDDDFEYTGVLHALEICAEEVATEATKDLEAQIEKMKNCFNCAKGDWNNRVKCIKSGCVNKDKWEIKEK